MASPHEIMVFIRIFPFQSIFWSHPPTPTRVLFEGKLTDEVLRKSDSNLDFRSKTSHEPKALSTGA